MALDIKTNTNIDYSPASAVKNDTAAKKAVDEAKSEQKKAELKSNETERESAIKKAIETMTDEPAKETADKKSVTEIAEEENLAIKETTKYGDELRVTNEGAKSSQVGGTVLASDEDGTVSEQNQVRIEANREAMEAMRAQIQETRENQARAMQQMRATAEANAERAQERNDLRDAENDAAEARKEVLIEEANETGNAVVETAKEHVDNLSGLTKNQVEQLYRDGRITQYEYQQNLESREANVENAKAMGQQNAEFVKETLANEAVASASLAMITAVDNGNGAVMEAALGITAEEDGRVQAIMS